MKKKIEASPKTKGHDSLINSFFLFRLFLLCLSFWNGSIASKVLVRKSARLWNNTKLMKNEYKAEFFGAENTIQL